MRIRAGTSGWSYKEWKGDFYPAKLAAKDFLRYYATQLPTVEVNNTFYRMPKAPVLEGWASQVPEDFSFVIKASKWITHTRRLKNVADPLNFLTTNTTALGSRLGPLLVQLPPNLRKDVALLRDFLALLPKENRAALEFRHASWLDDEVYEALREGGAALCVADTGEADDAPFVATADWGYLRLRRPEYGEEDLRSWVERVRGQSWKEAFVFFKHEDADGPRMAKRFLEISELATLPSAQPRSGSDQSTS